MDWSHYRFRSLWALPAPPATVYGLLEQAEDYPCWWPQVREVTKVSDTTGVITIRSVLPYDMTFTACEVRRDPEAGVLEIAMSGDIDGWARWTVTSQGGGSIARYDQVVAVNKPLLRRFAVPGRPVFRANHWLMMRAGRRGLVAHLAGGHHGGRQGGHGGGHDGGPQAV
ncbi:SRPBCC family protein [Streptomyces sp. DT2A-34]|uniref:SRPBCC family protein n=1 Tax=Streptomyces sp. DT2A-34 TaxID=3051182 RepID=UPI00265C8698|nr:SRPBCC family protein [Streptomyces sp. DT2A-34]MDO0916340.1 SRPBCC family protein [Streptomyces sp. DT2A-34]